MQSKATTPEQYLAELPEDRKIAMEKLRNIALKNLPKGFKEVMSYGMLGYVVPHEIYPNGYHCTPELPLPFFNIASQKNSINIYHMVLYGNKDLHDWFVAEYPKHCKSKMQELIKMLLYVALKSQRISFMQFLWCMILIIIVKLIPAHLVFRKRVGHHPKISPILSDHQLLKNLKYY